MGDSDSPELLTPKEATTPKSWSEIRNLWLNSRYSDNVSAIVEGIGRWEAAPRVTVDEKAWTLAIDEQVAKAKALLDSKRESAIMEETNKMFAKGKNCPPINGKVLTRVYIGVDPRRATDAYMALLDELDVTDTLRHIQAALNLEELKQKQLVGNMIVLYEPESRVEILDRILQSYRTAKQKRPDLFQLSNRQKASVMKGNIRQFKATIDANMSFVEMPGGSGGRSFDADDSARIKNAFGVDSGDLSIEQWLDIVRKKDARGAIYTYESQKRIDDGQVKSGDTLRFERRRSAPPLVQYGETLAA